MSRLITSDNALRALVLLSQRVEGLRASEVADALEISYTGAEKALDIIVADGLASISQHRYAFLDSPRAREAIRFALAFLPREVALAALAHGNEAVEFAGVDEQGALIVFRRFAEQAPEALMRGAVGTLLSYAPGSTVEFAAKEDVRDGLLIDLAPRRRAAGMRVLAGTVDRTFPDRMRHGDFEEPPLGRLNEDLRVPTGRRLRDLARRHRLRRIVAFGSATRADFRADSDLDLLVEPGLGRRLGLAERISLAVDADRLFGRDVDLLFAPVRRASLAERIDRDGVVLYDASR